jgi:HPt (histidine-containing phosphotransfer) domain-containing protein
MSNDRGITGCSPDAAITRLGGCVDLYREIVTRFLADETGLVRQLFEAIAAGDAKRVQYVAHTLKGSAGMCGADEIADIAHRLEQAGKLNECDKLQGLWGQFDRAFVAAGQLLLQYKNP